MDRAKVPELHDSSMLPPGLPGLAERLGTRAAWPEPDGSPRPARRRARTKARLYQKAKEQGIPGRSRMTTAELERALRG